MTMNGKDEPTARAPLDTDGCGEVDDYTLGLYAEEALPPERMAAVEAHLRGCQRCRSVVDEARQLAASVGRSPVGFGPGAHVAWVALTMWDGAPEALADEEREAIQRHVAACERCQADLDWMHQLDEAIGHLADQPMPDSFRNIDLAWLTGHPQSPLLPDGSNRIDWPPTDGAAPLRLAGATLVGLAPDASPAAEAVTAGSPNGTLLRPKRPWRQAPIVGLAVAAVLMVVAGAAVCRGAPSLTACVDEEFGASPLPAAYLDEAAATATAVQRLPVRRGSAPVPSPFDPYPGPGGPRPPRTPLAATPSGADGTDDEPDEPATPGTGQIVILPPGSTDPGGGGPGGGGSGYPGPTATRPPAVKTQITRAIPAIATLEGAGEVEHIYLPAASR
jgi:hypothetical protein